MTRFVPRGQKRPQDLLLRLNNEIAKSNMGWYTYRYSVWLARFIFKRFWTLGLYKNCVGHTENQTRVIMTLKRESSSCPKTDYSLGQCSTHIYGRFDWVSKQYLIS